MSGNKGHAREREVRKVLEAEGWWVGRCAGSLGDADLVAVRPRLDYCRVMLIEVKATAAGPYHSFGPVARNELAGAADMSGAEAWLYFWPPRGKLQRLSESDWPSA